MQDISLSNFKADIRSIREYIKHIDLINKVEMASRNSTEHSLQEFSNHLRIFSTDKKLFEYKAVVMSLYGVLEKHINIWIQEHIDRLPRLIYRYDNLPEKIYKNHFELSIKLISAICENRFYKYENLKKEDILTRLSSCINNPLEYKLNAESFSPLSGNLKHSKIVDAFKPLDIALVDKLKNNNKFSEFLTEIYGDNIANKGNELFAKIDDLVIRRNDIAHGANVDNFLSITEFNDYIEFLENYGQAIFETINEKEIQYEALFLYRKINNIKNIYDNAILCFEFENDTIEVGDSIIIETSGRCFLKKDIFGIQINNEAFSTLEVTTKTDICVDLGGGISKNQTFYIKIRNKRAH